MKNKSRIAWFSVFYIILFLFAIYNLIFLVIIWDNHELLNLYTQSFLAISNNRIMLTYSNIIAIYGLTTIGAILTFFGILGAILSQSLVSIASTPRKKLVGLVVGFSIVILGFYFGFIAQLFYYQWNDKSIMIESPGLGQLSANYFYKNWMGIIEIWLLFAIFLVFLVFSILLILKLHRTNLTLSRYNHANEIESKLEIFAPLPSNSEFDPNETQTITLTIDTTNKIMPWKKKKKKQKKFKKIK